MARMRASRSVISIHSTRVGGDHFRSPYSLYLFDFNPLHPCGRRPAVGTNGRNPMTFQSTPPVWAETNRSVVLYNQWNNFNPLHPCGRRLANADLTLAKVTISIHSTRVGGDGFSQSASAGSPHFNPLHPCGRRLRALTRPRRGAGFQSTPPVWAETSPLPAEFRDSLTFQSTPPVWAETRYLKNKDTITAISIHSTRVGGDLILDAIQEWFQISIHSARVGGDHNGRNKVS